MGTLSRMCLGWIEVAELVFDGFTLDLDGKEKDKRGFMIVGDDGNEFVVGDGEKALVTPLAKSRR